MLFKPFDKQLEFLTSQEKIRVLIAAKRSGKSEACYIDTIMHAENQPNYVDNGRDPYIVGIIAPTENMLRRLVWPKFREFAKPFEKDFNKSDSVLLWNSNNTVIYGFSAEKISRMEGYKIHHIHITEAFQCEENVFLESLARTSEGGSISIEGSLGTNIINPKHHWIYTRFVENKFNDSKVWEWTTAENPYFPKEELERLRDSLDSRTYRQMFTIDWNVPGSNLVYDEFDDANEIIGYKYDERLETILSVDWGWNHPMAALFFQYDRKNDTVYLFDEIVGSKILIDQLYARIIQKNYRTIHFYCDIAGNQEREQTGVSNVNWFKQPPRNIHFKYRKTAVLYGIPIVRSYIKNGKGQRRFYVDKQRCPKSVDGIKNYCYKQKSDTIVEENPLKEHDDAVDSIRYFFVNHLDSSIDKQPIKNINRWGQWN